MFLSILAGIATYAKLQQIQIVIPLRGALFITGVFFILTVAISAHEHKDDCAFDPIECDQCYFGIIAVLGITTKDPGLMYLLCVIATGASMTGSFIAWNRQRVANKKYMKK